MPYSASPSRSSAAPHEAAPEPGGTGTADSGPKNLLAVAGRVFFPLALIARLPYAMMVIGTLTLVVTGRDSLSLGGLTSAMVGLGAACFGPLIGAAADRWGQRRVLLVAGAANSVVLLLLTAAVFSSLGDWAVLAAGFATGATAPQIPPMSRSRLVGMISSSFPARRRHKVLTGTMAYESAADEVTFVFGPMIVGLLAAAFGAAAPMFAAVALTLLFVTGFALHRSSDEVPRHSDADAAPAPVSALFSPGLLTAVLGVLGIGFIFGGTLTSLTSFMGDAGHPERAGLVYSVMGIGSAVFALGAAVFPAGFSLRARWASFAGVILLGALGMQFADTIPLLLVALLLLGIGVGPTLVTLFSIVAERSPHGRSATAMSMASTGIVVGQSAASAVTGQLGERLGTDAAMLVPLAAAAVVIIASLINWSLSGRADRASAR
ncbi:MFS transporter [Gulosibacter sp. 10]|uniref:MFS transporter n=1 Tax=Gulosibacter sp. 10 TaxID=1255570 RepID=UPI00097F1880|nr:MFS transporter [Gulosibacter sp. 10]SJM71538.1 ABC transporter, permease protein [Gulosibacter sp. 10]